MAEEHYRKKLPKIRQSITYSFKIGQSEGYIQAGMYPNGTLGEIFVKIAKQGSTLAGLMDSIAIAVSLGLQYGTPLYEFVEKYMGTKFEPSGVTNDPEIPKAKSITDYIFRRLGMDFLTEKEKAKLGLTYEAPAIVGSDKFK